MSDCQVLIVGAGPVGLVLAIMLSMRGIDFRIIDKREDRTTLLRALTITKATEEIFSSIGIMASVKENALTVPKIQVDHQSYGALVFDYVDSKLDEPYSLHIYQPDIESILMDRLEDFGVKVNRGCELLDFESFDTHLEVRLKAAGEIENLRCDYIIGCDGVSSTVRTILGITCEEELYNGSFLLADVLVAGVDNNFKNTYFQVDDKGYLAVIPGPGHRLRIVQSYDSDMQNISISQGFLEELIKNKTGMRLKISKIVWEAKSHFRHQFASTGQKGRAFLAGDAYHVFSPVGGFNMNFGFQDAESLSQYLSAFVKDHKLSKSSAYELERKRAIIKLMKFTRLWTKMLIRSSHYDKLWRYFFCQAKESVSFRKNLMQRFSGLSSSIY